MSTQHAPLDTPAKPAPRRREVFDYHRIASSMTARTVEQLLDKTTDPALFIDDEGIIVGASEKLCQVFGRSPEDLTSRLWYEAIVPPDKQEEARHFVSSVLTGESDPATTWTCRLTTDEDRYVTITWHCVPPHEDAGDKGLAVLHGRGVLSDSDQVRHHLHELQVKYQGIVDNIATGVAIISPSMQVLKLNQQMQEWFPHINAVDKPLCYRSFNNPSLNKTCPWCPVRKTLADGQVHEAVTQTPAGDGKIRNYRIIASPLTDEAGSVVAAIEMVDDITDQLRAEEAIRQSEEQFRTVVNASMDAIIACDKRGRISVFNPAAEKMFGWNRDEAVGQPLEILLPTELTEEHRKTVASYLATGKPDRAIGRQREMEARRENGSLFPIEMTLSAATVSGQRSAVAIIRDITNRREAQDQLHELATQYSTMMDTVPALVYVKD
ncbi:PAS domain S-box protein, partial [candidate division GN15 bacterium]|nr:PAS domain S-box protein [candidate division GN15 bacterium]